MRGTLRTFWITVLVVIVAAAAFVTYRSTRSGHKSAAGVAADVGQVIPSSGAQLAAEVITPKGAGPFPLIVMPAGWGQPATQYRAVGRGFAADGYQVVAYAQRGFGKSTGLVDFAGSGSQRDVSTVISWALAHTKSDPKRVGMLGVSYGAGMSLLGAARDSRVRAVAALSTWTDVGAALDPGNTPSTAALNLLVGGAHPAARFDATTSSLRRTLLTRPKSIGQAVLAISRTRSPNTYVKQLNRNRPAIMIANGFEDSIFPPAQLVPFFDALTTPKRLELAGGDHGGPELDELLGARSHGPVTDAEAWFDHYLRGEANGIDTEGHIILKDPQDDSLRTYSSWPRATTAGERVLLGIPGSTNQTGRTAAANWQSAIVAGVDSTANSGQAQLVPSASYVEPHNTITSLRTSAAFVWIGAALQQPTALSGTPSLSLSLGSSAGRPTVFVYCYDVDTSGVGTLIDFQPYTAAGGTVSDPKPVTIDLQPVSWAIGVGHRIAIVIDPVDQRYASQTPKGAQIVVASTSKHRATFTAPAQT